MGGGFEISLACDFRIMSKSAVLSLPEVKLGAIAGVGGIQKLAGYVGRSKAMEWVLLATRLSAQTADEHNLLYAVVDDGETVNKAMELATLLKRHSPLAIAQSKASILVSTNVDVASASKFGLEALINLVGSEDWQEVMSAFVEKRDPKFN